MKVAPIGAFGAMAFTIGKYGIGSMFSLGKLMATFYVTCCSSSLSCSDSLPASMVSVCGS